MRKKHFLMILMSLVFIIPATAQVGELQQEVSAEQTSAQDTLQIQEVQPVVFKRDTTNHEIHLNVLNVLIFGALDVAYERVLTDHSAAAVELFTKVFNKNAGEKGDLSKVYAKDYSITGKFKYFFDDETVARGYYANLFAMFSNGTNETDMDFPDPETGGTVTKEIDMEYTDVAFGIGVGGKFVAKQGFLIDVSFGIGRNLFDKYSPNIVILPSVFVGYRF